MKKVLMVFLLCALLPSCKKEEMQAPPKEKPAAAAPLSLPDLSGKTVSLADFKGKPVVLNMWASWCVPCRAEMPELEKMYEARKSSGLVVIAVNFKESNDTATKFVAKNGLTFTVLLDEHGVIEKDYQLFGLPTTYFIDKSGIIQHTYMGEMTKEIINQGLKTIGVEQY